MIVFFFFQAEDGIRDLVRSRGLGDVYKRQQYGDEEEALQGWVGNEALCRILMAIDPRIEELYACLLYTSDAADERSSVDLGGRRIIKKKTHTKYRRSTELRSKLQITASN